MIAVCKNCKKKYKLSPDMLDVTFKCSQCGHIVHATSPEFSTSPPKGKSKKNWVVVVGVLCLLIAGGAAFFFLDLFPKPADDSPIVLGCPLAREYPDGWNGERGIKLAVEQINAQGGVKINGSKRPFEVVVIDTKDLDPGVPVSTALEVVEQLIVEKKADFILGGPVRSEAALAAMDLLSKHNKISILTTGVLTPKYHALIKEQYDKYKNCFRITGEAKWLVKEIVTCLAKIKDTYQLDKMQLMLQDVAHSRSGGDIIAKIATEQGWTITGKAVYPTGSGDFSRGLEAAAKNGTQVLLIWMDMPEASELIRQWYEMKIPALPFGSILSSAVGPDFWDKMDQAGEFCLANVVNAGNVPSDATSSTMAFYKAYTKKWGTAPGGYGTSSSYMAPFVLKDAIERANSLETNKVISALEKTDLMGVYGRIRFGKRDHQVIPSFDPREGAVGSIFQWQAGERVVVFPDSIAKSNIQLPPWMKPGDGNI
jgi:branched-chain amino acid transport system substrate-binding protein